MLKYFAHSPDRKFKQIFDIIYNIDNIHCLKNSYQLVSFLQKHQTVKNLMTHDFKDLFNNILLSDLSDIKNSVFNTQKCLLKLYKVYSR